MIQVEDLTELELSALLAEATEEAFTIADRIVDRLAEQPPRMPMRDVVADYREARLLMRRLRVVKVLEVGGRG